jgi:methyl-accepting chemotaxis protein
LVILQEVVMQQVIDLKAGGGAGGLASLSISQRLYALIVVGIVSMALLVGLNIFQMQRLFDAANYGNENSLPSLSTLNTILSTFSEQRVLLYRHSLTWEQEKKDEIEKRLKAVVEKRNQALQHYVQLVSGDQDKALFDKESALIKSYDEGVATVLDFSQKSMGQLALDELLHLAAIAEKINSAIQEHITYKQALAKAGAETALDTKTSTMVQALALLLVMGCFSLVVGLSIVRRIHAPLTEVVNALSQLAKGDLTFQVRVDSKDEIGQLKQALNSTVQKLRSTLQGIASEAHGLAQSSQQLARLAAHMSANSNAQTDSISRASSTLQQLTVSIDHVGANAHEAKDHAEDVDQSSLHSNSEFLQTSDRIQEVARCVEDSSCQILRLSNQVEGIGEVTRVIREVAEQTNLLALNAAIEAARAGEQGRGFAVVADEVRKLAERTTQSVEEITGMIVAIQTEVREAVRSMESSQSVVAAVVASAGRAGDSMQGIRLATNTVQSSVVCISEALNEQRVASATLARSVESIAQMSEAHSSTASTVAHTAAGLVTVSEKLKLNLFQFQF